MRFNYSDDLGVWNIVYPSKVYDASVDRSKETRQQGIQSALALLVIASVITFVLLSKVLKTTFGLSSFWAGLLVGLVIFIVALYIFRFGIFKEDAKMIEFNNENNADLGRFYEFLTGAEEYIDAGHVQIPCHKMITGSYAVCICLRHGSATASKRRATKQLLCSVFDILGSNNLSFKQLIMGEIYEETENYTRYINSLNNVKYSQLQRTLMSIAQQHLEVASAHNLVDSTYLMVYAKSSYQRGALASACMEIQGLLNQPNTVFRDVSFLSGSDFINVLKEYHGVEVIDLSTIRLTAPTQTALTQYSSLVSILKIITTDGSSIEYPEAIQDILATRTKTIGGK